MPGAEPIRVPPSERSPITAWDLPSTDGLGKPPNTADAGERYVVIGIADFTSGGLWFGDLAVACGAPVRFVGVDLRGRGDSWAAPPPTTMADHVVDVLDVAQRIGADSFTLVGHGTGAAVAVSTASMSERVDQVIMIDGPPQPSSVLLDDWIEDIAFVDPGASRLRATWAHRNAAITHGVTSGRLPRTGMSRALRRAVDAETVGAGFAWRARLGETALNRDWSLLQSWEPPHSPLPRGVCIRAMHGHHDGDPPVTIWDLDFPCQAVDTTHAGVLWDADALAVVAQWTTACLLDNPTTPSRDDEPPRS